MKTEGRQPSSKNEKVSRNMATSQMQWSTGEWQTSGADGLIGTCMSLPACASRVPTLPTVSPPRAQRRGQRSSSHSIADRRQTCILIINDLTTNDLRLSLMFSDSHFDAPPPQSQFRRPWSPDFDDQHSSSSLAFRRLQEAHLGRRNEREALRLRETSPPRHARREASDSSVEALDLADYARTLRLRQTEDPYPAFPSHIRPDGHAPSVFPSLIPGASSTDYLPVSVPSLISRGPTLSSSATHNTFTTTPRSSQRHFSLPLAPIGGFYANSSGPYLNHGPRVRDQYDQAAPTDDIDISRFPKWSRNWYDNDPSAGLGDASLDPDPDMYTPVPPSQFPTARTRKSMFDPGYVQNPSDAFDPYDLRPPPFASSAGHTSRETLPWKNDLSDTRPILDPMTKEERMRMLQKEFGTKENAKGKTEARGLVDEEGKPLIGTVDEQGQLVTVGPRRRVALKVLQVLLAAAACIPAIYAALVSPFSF